MNTTIAEIFGEKNGPAKYNTSISMDSDILAALDELATKYKVTRSDAVNRILRHSLFEENQLSVRTPRKPKDGKKHMPRAKRHERNMKMVELSANGYSYAQISRQFGLSQEYVRQIIINYKASLED
jgi:Mor family transcriptional regulator